MVTKVDRKQKIDSFYTFLIKRLQIFGTPGVLFEMEGDGGEEKLKQENQRQKSYHKPQVNSQDRHKSDGCIGDPSNTAKCIFIDHGRIDNNKTANTKFLIPFY